MLPITRIVLYKHGVGYFEREGKVDGDATLSLTFKQAEVSDVLKSLTVLDLDGGHVSSVSYDSTKPLEQLLAEVAISIPDQGSLVGLLPQLKGARVALHPQTAGSMSMRGSSSGEATEGVLLGIDTTERRNADGVVRAVLVSLMTDGGEVRSFELHALAKLEILDATLRRDLDYYLKTQLSSKKKDSRTFTFFAQGEGSRTIRLSYTLEAPVWKATYRMILGEEGQPPMLQGWAVVDNTQDEDWENVELALIAGLPVSFVHDLYTPRYLKRPVVEVKETTGVLPPEVEAGMDAEAYAYADVVLAKAAAPRMAKRLVQKSLDVGAMATSTPAQVRERQIGDLFEYQIEHDVTIRRNQSALVPIVLRSFEGRPVLLYNKSTREQNPMRCVEFKNTTGLTLEGGPVTVIEHGTYVGEAMLETTKPSERRLVPFAVELSVRVIRDLDSFRQEVNRVVIRNGHMTLKREKVEQSTYTLQSVSPREMTCFLDHERQSEWTLQGTPEPCEITDHYWRFSFELAGNQVTKFVVKESHTVDVVHNLADVNDEVLGLWMQSRYLDAKSAEVLKRVTALKRIVGERASATVRLQQERDKIHAEQQRIRGNLDSIGDRPSEKELRERFVRTLGLQEDRLEEIDREIREHTEERDRGRAEMQQLLDGLVYEAAV